MPLTPKQIEDYPAGYELDRIVAIDILNIPADWIHNHPYGKIILIPELGGEQHIACCKCYSSSIGDAWVVVNNLAIHSNRYLLDLCMKSGYGEKLDALVWVAEFRQTINLPANGSERIHFIGVADTPALAICRAALKVVASPLYT